eukprot:7925886-Lingulodinium_polyedra.AAC.1
MLYQRDLSVSHWDLGMFHGVFWCPMGIFWCPIGILSLLAPNRALPHTTRFCRQIGHHGGA